MSEWLSDGREGDVTLVQSMTLLAIFDFTGEADILYNCRLASLTGFFKSASTGLPGSRSD